eukprot:IDg18060t1
MIVLSNRPHCRLWVAATHSIVQYSFLDTAKASQISAFSDFCHGEGNLTLAEFRSLKSVVAMSVVVSNVLQFRLRS